GVPAGRANGRSAVAPAPARVVRAPDDPAVGARPGRRGSWPASPPCDRAGAAGARGRAPSRDRPRGWDCPATSAACATARAWLLRRLCLRQDVLAQRRGDPVDAGVEGEARAHGLGRAVRELL